MAKAAPVEPHVLCPDLLALQFFACTAVEKRQLLGGIEPFQPPTSSMISSNVRAATDRRLGFLPRGR